MKTVLVVRVLGLLAFGPSFGLGSCGSGSGSSQGAVVQPNVVVIVLDDVGTDKLRVYGESESPRHSAPPFCGVQSDPLDYPPTPNLDALAEGRFPGMRGGGIRFDHAYAAPVCAIARACLQSGRYGFRTGLGVVDDASGLRERLANEEVLLPELLGQGMPAPSSAGAPRPYRSAAFGKWHLSALPVCDPVLASDFSHPVDNGFELFQGTMANVGTGGSNPGDHFNWTKVSAVPGMVALTRYQVGAEERLETFQFSSACATPGMLLQTTSWSSETFSASVTRQDAVAWINAQDQPFFAYVSFNAPHFPYQVPPLALLSPETRAALENPGNCRGPYCAGQVAAEDGDCGTSFCGDATACTTIQQHLFFDAMLEAVDAEIGALLAQMRPEALANTLVVVVADNGTPGAAIQSALHDPTHGKGTFHELGVRVPMIVSGRPVPAGRHASGALVHAVDLWRTLADVAGADEARVAPLQPLDSLSFADVIRSPASAGARAEVFTQGFVFPGPYLPTEWGPYEPGCSDPTVPGVHACTPRNVGGHGRSLGDGRHKLIVLLTTPGADGSPPGAPDVRPEYVEQLFDLLLDPAETTDLVPEFAGDAGLAAIRDRLRQRMTQLSGY
ncbi:MAG TPA: sulfatase-like hydrolase/transferase [Planctomycetota bacterium]